MGITDEMLMAYADGHLTGDEAAEVERAMAADEDLATRVALMAEARLALKRAYGAAPPVSAALEARVRAMVEAGAGGAGSAAGPAAGSNVVDLAARRRVVPFWQVPLAAGLALAVGAGSVWLSSRQDMPVAGLSVGRVADAGLGQALGTLPSGAAVTLDGGARLVAIASFLDEAGQVCREVEHARDGATVVAVACHDAGAWDLRFAIATGSGADEGYVPAASLETLDAYMASTGAGAPLSAPDEAAALRGLD